MGTYIWVGGRRRGRSVTKVTQGKVSQYMSPFSGIVYIIWKELQSTTHSNPHAKVTKCNSAPCSTSRFFLGGVQPVNPRALSLAGKTSYCQQKINKKNIRDTKLENRDNNFNGCRFGWAETSLNKCSHPPPKIHQNYPLQKLELLLSAQLHRSPRRHMKDNGQVYFFFVKGPSLFKILVKALEAIAAREKLLLFF